MKSNQDFEHISQSESEFEAFIWKPNLVTKGKAVVGERGNQTYYHNGALIWNNGYVDTILLWFNYYSLPVPSSVIQYLSQMEGKLQNDKQK